MSVIQCECNSDRRHALLKLNRCGTDSVTGIEYVKTEFAPDNDSTIKLFFTGPPPQPIALQNVLVRHQRRGDEITVRSIRMLEGNCLAIHVDQVEPRATYQLRLVELENGLRTQHVMQPVDPRFGEVEFEFYPQGDRQSDVDPLPRPSRSRTEDQIELNYLAKDYSSFLRVLFDRLAQTMPNWRERRAADGFVAALELIAYVADRMSYFQDAVGSEAYLHTARRRISARRHARLVDYQVDEGCNARAFVHVQVSRDVGFDPRDVFFITSPPAESQLTSVYLGVDEIPEELYASLEVFEVISAQPSERQALERAFLSDFEVKDSTALAQSIYAASDAVAQRILGQFDDETALQFGQCGEAAVSGLSEHTLASLVAGINRLIRDEDLLAVVEAMPSWKEPAAEIRRRFQGRPKPVRNRAVLDEAMKDSISSAKLSQRVRLLVDLNEIAFYTWGEDVCTLAAGATSATLLDADLNNAETRCSNASTSAPKTSRKLDSLGSGDFLLFEEAKSPHTGNTSDADSAKRQVVRLTRVIRGVDPVTSARIVKIWWRDEDALAFDLCVSTRRDAPFCDHIENVSVARGNLVLVDHGRTIENEDLGRVHGRWSLAGCGSNWSEPVWEQQIEIFRPNLAESLLTHSRSWRHGESATQILNAAQHDTLPCLQLTGIPGVPAQDPPLGLPLEIEDLQRPEELLRKVVTWRDRPEQVAFYYVLEDLLPVGLAEELSKARVDEDVEAQRTLGGKLAQALSERFTWRVKTDLIGSESESQDVVVEIDNERVGHIRFGDGREGKQPVVGTRFLATYRTGHGAKGNVGSNAITTIVSRGALLSAVNQVRNPIPAAGGRDPETLEQIKLYAPNQFRDHQYRAVLASDYAKLVIREFADRVQNAKAEISWTGANWLVEIAIDPYSRVDDFSRLQAEIESRMQTLRRVGHQVRVDQGRKVPLELHITVDVKSDYARSEVRLAMIDLFSARIQSDGEPGLFHDDRLTFGEPIFVSQLVTAALQVAGVENAEVTRLSRLSGGLNVTTEPESTVKDPNVGPSNVLAMGPLEIAQLENTDRQETGRFCLTLKGGR